MLFILISTGFLLNPFPLLNAIHLNQHWIPSELFSWPNVIHLISIGIQLNHFPI